MKPMIKFGNGGAMVLTSSVMGLVGVGTPIAGSVGYAAAKHGVVGLMRTYANLLAQFNIRVNSIHPAGVNTPMIDNDFTRSWLEGIAQETQGVRIWERVAGADPGTRGHRQRGVLPVSDARALRHRGRAARRRRLRQQALIPESNPPDGVWAQTGRCA